MSHSTHNRSFWRRVFPGNQLTTKNNQTQHYIHQKHKRETKNTALANRTIYTLIWYGFYYLRSGNGVGPILTAPEPTRGTSSLIIWPNSKFYLPPKRTVSAFTLQAFTRWHHPNRSSRHLIAPYYSFIDPERIKG